MNSITNTLDLAPYISLVDNFPYGMPGTHDELSCEGAFQATCEALRHREPFSIIRMSDGEARILDYCDEHAPHEPMLAFDAAWNLRYGVVGITCGETRRRLYQAAEECTILGQDGWVPHCITGVRRFIHRTPFVWPRFPEAWTARHKRELYALAGEPLLIINRDRDLAEHTAGGADFDYLPLANWDCADEVVRAAELSSARLALVSCGPGSKQICPGIARQGRVVLDIGSAPERGWWNEQPRV